MKSGGGSGWWANHHLSQLQRLQPQSLLKHHSSSACKTYGSYKNNGQYLKTSTPRGSDALAAFAASCQVHLVFQLQ